MQCEIRGSIDYLRQCILLAAAAGLVIFTDRWRPLRGAVPSLGFFAVLHASIFTASLRVRWSPWQKLGFVALAGSFAMLSFLTARCIISMIPVATGKAAPAMLLMLSSGLGAASYALLIRCSQLQHLAPRAVAWTTLSCVATTLLALPLGIYLHTAGAWWFAIIWWWTFSLSLWRHALT